MTDLRRLDPEDLDPADWSEEDADTYTEQLAVAMSDLLDGRHPYSVVMALDVGLEANLEAVFDTYGPAAARDVAHIYKRTLDPYLDMTQGQNYFGNIDDDLGGP